MSSLEEQVEKLAREMRDLRSDLQSLKLRVGSLEAFNEVRFDPPTIRTTVREVVEPGALETAMKVGELLSDVRKDIDEGRREARGAKESARALRRVVSPEDDTGAHQLPDRKEK